MAEATTSPRSGSGPARELLLHLAKGGELLRADRVAEARLELEQALAIDPREPRARSLLGFACFRLGELDRAQRIYRELVGETPRDGSLRLNLGLVCLKSGDLVSAVSELRAVIDLEPGNKKALGYLGLAYARRGELAAARDALRAAGQEELARQMETALAKQTVAKTATREPVRASSGADDFDLTVTEAPIAAATPPAVPVTMAARPLPPSTVALASAAAVAAAVPGGATLVLPERRQERSVHRALPLSQVAADWLLEAEESEEPFDVHEDGALLVRVRPESGVLVRGPSVIAMTGALDFVPAHRHVRGRELEDPLGGSTEPLFLVRGHGTLLLQIEVDDARRATLVPVVLAQETLYVREAALLAFDETLRYENGRVPGQTGAQAMLQLRGDGRAVLRLRGRPSALRVLGDRPVYADARKIVGWIGRVVPRLVARGEEGVEGGGLVELLGDGVVFLGDTHASAVSLASASGLPEASPEAAAGTVAPSTELPADLTAGLVDPEVASFAADLAAEAAAPIAASAEVDFAGLNE